MVSTTPLAASGSREPEKRPRPIPQKIRDAIVLMVYGRADDPDCRALPCLEAGRECGIKPDVMRKYLDRSDVRRLLMAERRAFRAAVCAGNEGALQRVRDKSANGMATVAAVRALEQLDDENAPGARGVVPQAPGFVIVIAAPGPVAVTAHEIPSPQTIDHGPISGAELARSPPVRPYPGQDGPVFRHPLDD
jgi:hypothetical protein